MAYASPMKIANGLVLDFTVDNADTAADTFLGLNASGEVTKFASVPRARVSGGGNITEATSSVLTITGGTAAVLTSGLTIQVKLAGAAQSGYLSTTDWNTFNNKLGASLTSAYIYVGNGSNVATGVAVSGDISLTNTGNAQIVAGAIVNADVNASAAIAVSKLEALTASRVLGSDGSGVIQALNTATYPSLTELAYVKGVTSAIQTQLNNRLSVTLSSPTNGDVITYNGSAWVNSPSSTGVPTGGTTAQILRKIDNTNYNTEWHTLVAADITDVSSTAAELNKLSGVTTTATQFNFLNTLSGNVQDQLAAKVGTSLTQNYMFVGDASNVVSTLAPGTNGYVLTSVSGVPTWVSPGVGGTVTSVAASGGTTGMSFTGSPITTSGTLTLTGTLAIANGGTGLTALGTAGQLIKVNAGATALEYFTPTYISSVGTGVANELTYWSGTSTLGSLATATYPSLTELSYVKGVTSAIQTQLNGKQSTLTFSNGLTESGGAVSLGGSLAGAATLTNASNSIYFDPSNLEIGITDGSNILLASNQAISITYGGDEILSISEFGKFATDQRVRITDFDANGYTTLSSYDPVGLTTTRLELDATDFKTNSRIVVGANNSGQNTAGQFYFNSSKYQGRIGTTDYDFPVTLTGNTANRLPIWQSGSILGQTPYTVPTTNGTNGYVLTTDGSGAASWAAPSGGGGIGGSTGATDNSILRADGAGGATLQNSAFFVDDSANITLGTASLAGNRTISAVNSTSDANLTLTSQGSVVVDVASSAESFQVITTNDRVIINPAGFQLFGEKINASANATFLVSGAQGIVGSTTGQNLLLQSGSGYGSGITNGGHVYLMYGSKNSTGLDGNIGLLTSSVADWQDMERGVYLANRGVAPTAGIANGVALYAEDVNSSSEFYVTTESGAKVNISGLLDPVTESGTSFTLNETHRNKIVLCTNSGVITVTVNTGKAAGWNCMLVATHATGTISLTASSTTINGVTATTTQFDTLSIVHYGSENYLSKLG